LQENVEECQSAAEFLLEPWILVQLPFQPLLLHQWAVALLAEALKFQRELDDVSFYPVQVQSLVKKLDSMGSQLGSTAFKYLSHFSDFAHKGIGNYTLQAFPETLAVLEFVLSADCRNVVKALKRRDWSRSTKTCCLKFPNSASVCCYSPYFWRGESASVASMMPQLQAKDAKPRPRKSTEATDAELEGLRQLVEEKLVKTGRLTGASDEYIFDLLVKFKDTTVPLYRIYKFEEGKS